MNYFEIIDSVINIILTYLAIRAIGRDEALVRSLDRLRQYVVFGEIKIKSP